MFLVGALLFNSVLIFNVIIHIKIALCIVISGGKY